MGEIMESETLTGISVVLPVYNAMVRIGDDLMQVQTPHRIEFAEGDKCFLRFPNAMWYPVEDEAEEAERNRRQLV